MLIAAIFVIFPFCMAYAAISDVLSMTIANRVSALLIGSFVIIAPLTGMDWATFGMHFAGAGAVLAVTFTIFAIGGMGGGDAKLLTATALWMGFSIELLQYLVFGSFLGGVLTLAILNYRNSDISVFTGGNLFLRHFADPKAGIPYGVALGAAGLMVFPSTPLAQWAVASLAAG